MTPTTKGIPAIDFYGSSEWFPLIAPYSFYHRGPVRNTAGIVLPFEAVDVHAPVFVPGKNSIAFIKSSLEGELLSNLPSNLLSFLSNRGQHVQDGYTYETIIEQDEIELLRSFVEGRTASHPVVISLTREAEAFCNRQGIRKYVTVASDLLNQCFSNVQGVDSEVLQDPDTDTEDQLLVIHVEVKGEIEAVLDMYDKYTEEWVSRVPWPERAKISLSYIII